MRVLPEVEHALRSMHALHKPIGAMCISPVILAKVFGAVQLTIGKDAGTAEKIKAMGADHKITANGQVVVDAGNKLVSTPCYMLDASIADIGEGARQMVKAMMELM
jgi:enhancing lycopene biosynthesis protein 2